MPGPTCTVWASLTPLSLGSQVLLALWFPVMRATVASRPGPPGAVKLPQRFFYVNRFSMALEYGHAGRLTAKNGVFFGPGSLRAEHVRRGAGGGVYISRRLCP
jgi:hypothetical protein